MPYSPQTWVDSVTQVDAAHMNHIEAGIAAVDSKGKVYLSKPAANITRTATTVGSFSTAWQITGVVVASGQNVQLRVSAATIGATAQDYLFAFKRGSTQIASQIVGNQSSLIIPFVMEWVDENPGAGTYTYEVQAAQFGAGTLNVYQSNINSDTGGGTSVFVAEVYTP